MTLSQKRPLSNVTAGDCQNQTCPQKASRSTVSPFVKSVPGCQNAIKMPSGRPFRNGAGHPLIFFDFSTFYFLSSHPHFFSFPHFISANKIKSCRGWWVVSSPSWQSPAQTTKKPGGAKMLSKGRLGDHRSMTITSLNRLRQLSVMVIEICFTGTLWDTILECGGPRQN